jgi:hypothetical protein
MHKKSGNSNSYRYENGTTSGVKNMAIDFKRLFYIKKRSTTKNQCKRPTAPSVPTHLKPSSLVILKRINDGIIEILVNPHQRLAT